MTSRLGVRPKPRRRTCRPGAREVHRLELLREVRDHLRVPLRAEAVPGALELDAELTEVVDLAVEDDSDGPVLVGDRGGSPLGHSSGRLRGGVRTSDVRCGLRRKTRRRRPDVTDGRCKFGPRAKPADGFAPLAGEKARGDRPPGGPPTNHGDHRQGPLVGRLRARAGRGGLGALPGVRCRARARGGSTAAECRIPRGRSRTNRGDAAQFLCGRYRSTIGRVLRRNGCPRRRHSNGAPDDLAATSGRRPAPAPHRWL